MRWIILFVASWIAFIYLVDWKKLKVNIWCGLWAILLAVAVDTEAADLGLYEIRGPLMVADTTLLFILGPVFVVGTLVAQFYPKKRYMRILNIFILFVIYSCMELLLVFSGDVVYLNWHFHESLLVNLGAMISVGWFSIVVLDKGSEAKQ